jgi:hypothetical protein
MKQIRILVMLTAMLAMLGCGRIDVKPYEREQLANPLLSFSRDPISDQYLDHVYEVREGARGASITTGGGCGCN